MHECLLAGLLTVRGCFSAGSTGFFAFSAVLLFACSEDPSASFATDAAERFIGEMPWQPDTETLTDVDEPDSVDDEETVDAVQDAPDGEPDMTPADMTDPELLDLEPGEPDGPTGESCGAETEQPSEPVASVYFGDFDVIVDEDIGTETRTMEIMLDTTVDIHAYEIALCGVTVELLDGTSGLAAENGIGVRTDGVWIAGFGGSTNFIPASSSGVLFTLSYTRNEAAIDVCFVEIGLYDGGGFEHDPTSHGSCHSF